MVRAHRSRCELLWLHWLVARLLTSIVITSEPAELVKCEEGMGDFPDISFDIHHLRPICHLHCWNSIYHIRITREHSNVSVLTRTALYFRRVTNGCNLNHRLSTALFDLTRLLSSISSIEHSTCLQPRSHWHVRAAKAQFLPTLTECPLNSTSNILSRGRKEHH
jgi:hypothetical protein